MAQQFIDSICLKFNAHLLLCVPYIDDFQNMDIFHMKLSHFYGNSM